MFQIGSINPNVPWIRHGADSGFLREERRDAARLHVVTLRDEFQRGFRCSEVSLTSWQCYADFAPKMLIIPRAPVNLCCLFDFVFKHAEQILQDFYVSSRASSDS
ncbi:hypothetical protein N7530_002984 [Penicillium desertorum]|uniref:Uncharacterized protein n=1 Tax=Penicillium desertorum TaxID=1303715 RepID=A0A9W9X4H8_9EURO|nr:hypothetical protein N7530_002984 [Penicillium desertorum]